MGTRFVSVKEAAQSAGLTADTVWRWVRMGAIVHKHLCRVGRAVKVAVDGEGDTVPSVPRSQCDICRARHITTRQIQLRSTRHKKKQLRSSAARTPKRRQSAGARRRARH